MGSLGAPRPAQAAFSSALSNALQTRTYIVSKTATDQFTDFEEAADAVMKMWNDLFSSDAAPR
jgi:hypothetical protein